MLPAEVVAQLQAALVSEAGGYLRNPIREHLITCSVCTTPVDGYDRCTPCDRHQEPYASADRVFWVVDNGSSHRGQKAIDWLAAQFPNAIMAHTPVHASWLNQIEIYFSIKRKVLSPNDFTDLAIVEQRLARFEDRYNDAAKPFKWKFTTTDLDDILERLDRHQPAEPEAPQASAA